LTVPARHVGHGAQTGDMSPLYWRPGRPRHHIGGTAPTRLFPAGRRNQHGSYLQCDEPELSLDAVQEFQGPDRQLLAELAGRGRSDHSSPPGTTNFMEPY